MRKKKREKCRKYLFSHPFSYGKLCIYIHTLQYQCNRSLNCTKQYKEGIGHEKNTLQDNNQSNISNISSNIDCNYQKRYFQLLESYNYFLYEEQMVEKSENKNMLGGWDQEKECDK